MIIKYADTSGRNGDGKNKTFVRKREVVGYVIKSREGYRISGANGFLKLKISGGWNVHASVVEKKKQKK